LSVLPRAIKAGTQLKLSFRNRLGETGLFHYVFSLETTLPGLKNSFKRHEQSFNLSDGSTFASGLLLPKIPGTYRLQVYLGSKVILDKTLEVVA
jgi:hypothetical protein